MKLVSYDRGSDINRIGIVCNASRVLDLEKAFSLYLQNKHDLSVDASSRISRSFFTNGMIDLIEKWSFVREIIKQVSSYCGEEELFGKIIYDIKDIRFRPVISNPPKLIGIGLNYDEYRVLLKYPKPEVPLFFFKPTNTLIGHLDKVVIPRGRKWPGTSSNRLFHEFELAIIIGKKGKFIDREKAYEHVFGYTIFSDITANDIEMIKPGHVLYQQRAKAFDTFSPIGPWIVTRKHIEKKGVDIHNLSIKRKRNNNIEGESNTKNMIYKVPEIIEFLSEIMTLYPGDIISLGSPPTGPPEGLQHGDIISVIIEEIGELTNYVVKK